MKLTTSLFLFLPVLLLFSAPPLFAGDMRELAIQASKIKEKMFLQAAEEKRKAEQIARQNQARIKKDRAALTGAVTRLKEQNLHLKQDIKKLKAKQVTLDREEKQLSTKLAETSGVIRELVGAIRVSSRDIDTLLAESNSPPPYSKHGVSTGSLATTDSFPGMNEIRSLAETLFAVIANSGEVSIRRGEIVNRKGEAAEADILLLGPFTAIYRLGEEIGFLNYTAKSDTYYALTHLPKRRAQKTIKKYMAGKSDTVTMDISRGAALRRLTHQLSLLEQIPKGGPITWPILIIFAVGILIIFERLLFLFRIRVSGDDIIKNIEDSAAGNTWQNAIVLLEKIREKPMARVLEAGLLSRNESREDLENSLQEAILKEIPSMERFLSTLGMLAAIAPLLGLLGTVTGMIATFHIITLYGTGDPRLMSGGISEALVTTMLGLSVAIPLMLAQTLLSRSVDRHIGELEEKAVTLVNIILKYRRAE
ncbi:MotA/TolQ/ExbB proton channel family protein [Desulfomarina sp.]